MKLYFAYFALVLTVACSSLEDRQESLKMFGSAKFNAHLWAASNEYVRGTMIYDFVSSNAPITDRSREFIVSALGGNTGYHEYGYYPAYYVGPEPPEGNARAYLVAFIIDPESGNVCDIHIHPEPDWRLRDAGTGLIPAHDPFRRESFGAGRGGIYKIF